MVESTEEFLVERPSENLTVVRKNTSTPVRGSWFFLHGLSSNAEVYLEKVVKEKTFVIPDGFRVLLPTAPKGYVTEKDAETNRWYNQNSKDVHDPTRYSEPEQLESVELISQLVRDEANSQHGGDFSKIFISGFSQGCGVTLLYSLLSKDPLVGGVIAYLGIVMPVFFRLREEGGEAFAGEHRIPEKAENLRVLHYVGTADLRYPWDSRIKENADAVFSKHGFKHYQMHIEEGMAHVMDQKAFQAGVDFIEESLKLRKE